MVTMKRAFVVSMMMASMAMAGCAQTRPVVYAQGPPPVFRHATHEGYHDGVMAAQRDMQRGLRPDVARHEHFRTPPVRPRAVQAYRDAFRDGYRDAYRHAVRRGY